MFDSSLSVDDLDARGVCESVLDAKMRQLRADADIALAVAHWCDLHACPDCHDGQLLHPDRPGSERAKTYGAEDNPQVLEFCVAELAAASGQHVNGTVELVADVQDLRFRHPLLWARVQALQVPFWKARKIVGRTRHLSRERAQLVDARTADVVAGLAWGRFCKLLDGAIIAADPETAAELRRAAAKHQFAGMGQPDEQGHGMRTFTARTKSSDIVWFDAMCRRIADMLKALGDADPRELRRAKAFALLGHPVKVIALFAEYERALAENQTTDPADPTTDSVGPAGNQLDLLGRRDLPVADEEPVSKSDVHPANNAADDDDADVPCPACAGAGSLDPRVAGDPTPFVKLATGLHLLDWSALLPKVTFYVHGSAADLSNQAGGSGVVRVEGHGALTVSQAREFFGHDTHHITVKPVIDPAQVRPVDAYETPDWMAEVVHLLSPGDIFPYANHVGRGVDLDHLAPYLDPRSSGPPGQTHPDNLGPMTRFHHRVKTHGRWRMRVVRSGVQVWRTPHGFYFQTDPRGTHPLTDEAGQLLWEACAHNPEAAGTGRIRAEDIPRITAGARAPDARAPTGPTPAELELFKVLERYEDELSPA